MTARFAFYGDDFTGSVDALLQFRRTGLDGLLVTSPDAAMHASDADVVGIAGVARSLPSAELNGEVRPAIAALLELEPDVLQYKVCSTADSSPEIGSIGRVIEIGRALVGTSPVPVLFAQPDFGRYTVFGHHFAAEQGEVYRIDRQPTMASHPITPIRESDMRRHLAMQTALSVGSVPWTAYGTQEAPVAGGPNFGDSDILVMDALTDEHLRQVGFGVLAQVECGRRMFVVGSGGMSRGLGLARGQGHDSPLPTAATPAPDRTLVLSGSASVLTWRQVQAAVSAGFMAVDLFAEDAHGAAVRLIADGHDVVVYSTVPGRNSNATSGQVEAALAAIGTAALRARPATRLVVCGGDTSGNVLRRMGVDSLKIETNPWGMVSLCRAAGAAENLGVGTDVVLKGGQMGHETLFADIRAGVASTASDRPASSATD